MTDPTMPVGPLVKVDVYRDEGRNLVIEMLTPVQSLAELMATPAPPQYVATINVNLPTPRGPLPLPIRIPIDAANVTEAFEKFEEQAHAKLPGIMRQKQQDLENHMKKLALANPGPQLLAP